MKKITLLLIVCITIGISIFGYFFYRSERIKLHEANFKIIESLNIEAMNENLPRLQIQDAKEGEGSEATEGDHVEIDYTARLADGKIFDQTLGKKPFVFTIGKHETLKGLEYGVVGMKPKGRRFVTIPPHLGFGDNAAGNGLVPPSSTVQYEVELIRLKKQ